MKLNEIKSNQSRMKLIEMKWNKAKWNWLEQSQLIEIKINQANEMKWAN